MTDRHGQPDPLITIGEVARRFNVTVKTVRRWDKPGLLPAVRTPGGQRRYRTSDVEAFIGSQPGADEDDEHRGAA